MIIEWTYVAFFNFNYRIYALYTDFFIFICIILFILVISCKTPKLHDIFNIRGETKRLLICVLFQLFGAQIIYFIAAYFGLNDYSITIIQAHWFSLWAFLAILVQTWYVFKILGIDNENNLFIRSVDYSLSPLQLQLNITSSNPFINNKRKHEPVAKSQQSDNPQTVSLARVLKNEQYFQFFMEHLMMEFSAEVIISFIEFQQYQVFMMGIHEFSGELGTVQDDFHSEYKIYELNKEVPLSWIVYNSQDRYVVNDKLLKELSSKLNENGQRSRNYMVQLLTVKNIAYKLYMKYVKTGSEFEVNISAMARDQFEEMMDNYIEWIMLDQSIMDLLDLFQEIKLEMLMLLGFSYGRFIKSEEFELLLHE